MNKLQAFVKENKCWMVEISDRWNATRSVKKVI